MTRCVLCWMPTRYRIGCEETRSYLILNGGICLTRIAYLFLSHRTPEIMLRTMDLIQHPDDAFFIHFDKKIISDSLIKSVSDRAFVIADPVDVRWGTFSMVEAALALLIESLKSGDFTHFVLLSDDAFPLKDADSIRSGISSGEFGMQPRPVLAESTVFQDRYRYFYLFGKGSAKERLLLTPAERDDVISLGYWLGRGKADVRLYHGSQWWAVSRVVANFMVREHFANDHLRMSFYYSRIPDEHYFQTMIGNSEYRQQSSKMTVHTEWPPPGQVWPGPRTFVVDSDFTAALNSDRLFVRKIANLETAERLYEIRQGIRGGAGIRSERTDEGF